MRLDEIIDKREISRTLNEYFGISGYVSIDDNGYVSINGDCNLNPDEIESLPIIFNKVDGSFNCSNNNLTSLIGCPKYVGGDFQCNHNQLSSLVGGPNTVGRAYECEENWALKSLDGLPLKSNNGYISLTTNSNLPLLKLLLIKDLKRIIIYKENKYDEPDDELTNIFTKYLGKGRGGVLACAAELTRAGYKGNAKL